MAGDDLLRLAWMTIPCDAEGEREVADFLEEANARAQEIKEASRERLAQSGEQSTERVVCLLGFPRAVLGGHAGPAAAG